jgi:hypothetical protein
VDSACGIRGQLSGGAVGRDPLGRGEPPVAAASGDAERTAACGGAVGVEATGRAGGVNGRCGVERQCSVPSWPGARHPKVEGWRAVRQGEWQAGGAGTSGAGWPTASGGDGTVV